MNNILAEAANNARGLAIDAIHKCSSGHLGLPLGSAEIGAVLYGNSLSHDPSDPKWINRDRFILSAGHGSMFLYSWLHISGYDLSLEEVKNFRQLGSKTPGHPEYAETPGVEATTGPLGQGIGNAVGYAVSGKMAAARFNTDEHEIFNHHIFALAGDGCLQEGVAAEAAAFAGHFNLDNLILLYDSNDVTLDAMAVKTQTEDTGARFAAMGWDTSTIDGHDINAVAEAISKAKSDDNGKPKLIICKTEIGRGIPEVAGTAAGHGEGGAKYAESARTGLGLPEETFYVSEEVKSYFTSRAKELSEKHAEWKKIFEAWQTANPDNAKLLEQGLEGHVPDNLDEVIPEFDQEAKLATRAAGGVVLQPIAEAMGERPLSQHCQLQRRARCRGLLDTTHGSRRRCALGGTHSLPGNTLLHQESAGQSSRLPRRQSIVLQRDWRWDGAEACRRRCQRSRPNSSEAGRSRRRAEHRCG